MSGISVHALEWFNSVASTYYCESRPVHFFRETNFPGLVKQLCDSAEWGCEPINRIIFRSRSAASYEEKHLRGRELEPISDPRATYELFLMGQMWGRVYPTDEAFLRIGKERFGSHVAQGLSDLQIELLVDMIRDSFGGDDGTVFRVLLPVVDGRFESLVADRIEATASYLKGYQEKSDWEGDYFDQVNVLMYQNRLKELKQLQEAIRKS